MTTPALLELEKLRKELLVSYCQNLKNEIEHILSSIYAILGQKHVAPKFWNFALENNKELIGLK